MGWLSSAIFFGGVIAPVLLMLGLAHLPASSASLLLNAEGVFTALLAWFVFRENFDRRIAIGMACITAGALMLSWPDEVHLTELWPALCVIAACFAWAVDNNLTRKVSLADATSIAALKGLSAGVVNFLLSFWFGAEMPSLLQAGIAMTVGLFGNCLGAIPYGARRGGRVVREGSGSRDQKAGLGVGSSRGQSRRSGAL